MLYFAFIRFLPLYFYVVRPINKKAQFENSSFAAHDPGKERGKGRAAKAK